MDQPTEPKNNRKYEKDKPWDTDDIDHWKIVPVSNEHPLLETSSFATLFPKYRQVYIQSIFPRLTQALLVAGIAITLDLIQGSITVETTEKTFDPFIIFKARDLIKLISRSVPFEQSVKILQDDTVCDVVKIGGLVRNKERFVKRRQRLLGPNGNTLKAIELLTSCYVLVQGNTVACMGPYKGLKNCRRIIMDCFKNIHPIYHIKELLIKRELLKDDKLKNESWDRFLPKFKKQSVTLKKPKIKRKEYTPFPPVQQPRKIDLQMESGEYFLTKVEQAAKKLEAKVTIAKEKSAEKRKDRAQDFVAPAEPVAKKVKKEKKEKGVDIEQIKAKLGKPKKSKRHEQDAKDYVL